MHKETSKSISCSIKITPKEDAQFKYYQKQGIPKILFYRLGKEYIKALVDEIIKFWGDDKKRVIDAIVNPSWSGHGIASSHINSLFSALPQEEVFELKACITKCAKKVGIE